MKAFNVLLVLTFSLLAGRVYAQPSASWAFESRRLAVGALSNYYNAGGAKQHVGGCHGLEYPHWYRYTCNQTGAGLWIGAKNFTDEAGTQWPHKVAHVGYRNTGAGEVFPVELESFSRIEPPMVYVDDLESFEEPTFYDEIDPDLAADGVVTNVVNTVTGVTMERTVYAFSNEYHDNYHVIEYEFVNTGNTDGDDEIEVEQTLEDVYVFQARNYEINQMAAAMVGNGGGWGRNVLHDVVGDGLKQYQVDFRAQYSWLGYEPGFERWNSIGGPALDDNFSTIFEGDSLGRLTAAHMVGFVTLHADEYAHGPEETAPDDPQQPSLTGYITNGWDLNVNDSENREKMAREYQFLEGGHLGSHADAIAGPPQSNPEPVEAWRQRMASQTRDPGIDIEGLIHTTAYGPYTLEPGQRFRIMQAEGVAGLSPEAALAIGKAYKDAHLAGDEDRLIPYDANGDGTIGSDEEMSKNMWVMTARDSLFKTFERARANWESGLEIPSPPLPPREFRVTSNPDQIVMEWDVYAGANPVGFQLWRAGVRREGDYELIAGTDELGPGARSYEDTDVQRGISYFYYLQAVGEENTDDTGMTPTGLRLKSSRAYTQTYDPAFLKRPPGGGLSEAQVVPNPYNMASADNVRWPDQRDRIGFLDVPGDCTIKIFTQLGELVETITHTDGSGDAFWDLTTSSNQLVVSGIYLAVIQDNTSGEQIVRKFTIIR